MSHLDDVDFVLWGPVTGPFCLAIIIAVIVWACIADNASANLCKDNGEKYIDSRTGYTLCERADGTVVRR